jgi:hypothetical protein
MIYVNSVINAVNIAISSDATIVNCGVNVDVYETFNSDPNRTPWVGIYQPDIDIEPKRANITKPWMAQYNIPVFVQVEGTQNKFAAQDELDKLTTIVMTAVNCNREFSDTVNITLGYTINPFEADIEEKDYFFTNEIRIIAEVFA